jgi:hypothetical protein
MWKLVYPTRAKETKCLFQKYGWTYGTVEFQLEEIELAGFGYDRGIRWVRLFYDLPLMGPKG